MDHLGSAKEFFFDEATEHLAYLESGLLQIETQILIDENARPGAELIDSLFRSAHTLKGASALLKFKEISDIAHEFEELLEQIKLGSKTISTNTIDAMLVGIDAMRALLHAVEKPEYKQIASEVVQNFNSIFTQALDSTKISRAETTQPEVGITNFETVSFDSSNTVKVDIAQIDKMMNLLGELTVNKSHILDQVSHAEGMKEEIDFARERLLREIRVFSERHEYSIASDSSAEESKRSELTVADFDELEFDRYDELNLFSRKLQEISNDINEGLSEIHTFLNSLSLDVDEMDRMTAEMKEKISAIRTLPVEHLYRRFKRTFRNLFRAQDNISAQLELKGGETLIGRTVIEGLFDPMVHLLRNALAHGIESKNERLAAGKPSEGTVTITAVRRGNSAVITVSDDGRGISLEKVRDKAVSLGWLEPDFDIEQRALIDMIFRPGFSTQVDADELSGRGVGMDVVLDRISALNGTIDVVTEEGKGTSFILQIPLSLIIINVVQFRVGHHLYVIPTTLVEEIQGMRDLDVVGEHVVRQGERYRILNLNTCFSIPEADATRRCVLFVKTMGARIGLSVEEVLTQEDTVIRAFGSLLDSMRCFSGTSVSGGGDIRLVINPARLVDVVGDALHQNLHAPAAPIADTKRSLRVLIVDDSLSVRKYASLILEGNGIEVLTAVNGQEALNLLETEKVDFVFTDLEMPVMHGYELLAELKRRESLAAVPVVVITSRAGSQHKEKALNMGACGYLVKPFDEDSLLGKLRELTLY
ncbi:MAG: response regulator [Desulfuromonadaceae bacterium]|nr:response regulator [Desulfuromonas sp.]MDY0184600.1 response regulator [Desulfuromonadaceae bacterium]